MDDFGVLIYLVGLVAYYLYRGFRKSKKPGQKSQERQVQPASSEYENEKTADTPKPVEQKAPKKEFSFEDIFKEAFDIEDLEVKEKPEPVQLDNLNSEQELFAETEKVKESSISKKIAELNTISKLKKSPTKKRKKKVPINLRKAIIHQSVLERPYK